MSDASNKPVDPPKVDNKPPESGKPPVVDNKPPSSEKPPTVDNKPPSGSNKPDNTLPGTPNKPDNTLPGSKPGIDNTLPSGPNKPDNTLPSSERPVIDNSLPSGERPPRPSHPISGPDIKRGDLAAKMAIPLESSQKRSESPGNTYPIKPEDRPIGDPGNTGALDALSAAMQEKKRAEDRIETLEKVVENQEEDPLYKRDMKILELAKQGKMTSPSIVDTEVRAESDLRALEQREEAADKRKKEVDVKK